MGIYKLMQFIKKQSPNAIRHLSPSDIKNKRFVIDASNTMYQFLIKTQTMSKGALSQQDYQKYNPSVNIPTDWQGNKTGHLIGIMYRVLMCLQYGIKSIWVFDGPPPKQKYDQLKRRRRLKQQAEQKMQTLLQQAEAGSYLQSQQMLKFSQRSTFISSSQKKDAMKLLSLMGMPVIQSPGEAEPQCAQIVKQGLSQAIVSQDLDNLVYGTRYLIRGFTKKNLTSNYQINDTLNSTIQIDLKQILLSTNFTLKQFVDFCILCGCDYSSKIPNIGPINAFKLITKHQNIQKALQYIVSTEKLRTRHRIPDQFNFLRARNLFQNPTVKGYDQILNQFEKSDNIQYYYNQNKKAIPKVKINQIKQKQLKDFLMEKQFSPIRVQNWLIKAGTFKQKWEKQSQYNFSQQKN